MDREEWRFLAIALFWITLEVVVTVTSVVFIMMVGK